MITDFNTNLVEQLNILTYKSNNIFSVAFQNWAIKDRFFLPEFQLMSSFLSSDSLTDKVTNDESVKQFTLDMFRSLNSVHASDKLVTVI